MALRRDELQEIRQIALGGMARLTLAVDPRGQEVVLRQLRPNFAFHPRAHFAFLRGLRIRRRLFPHPNIVSPIARGYCGLVPYEIIEYVPGENLRELILHKHDGVKTHAADILRQAATALSHMHAKHLLHLDVKPENVLIDTENTEDGITAKLTDFDLSRRLRGGHEHLRAGTASHMAPEQLILGRVTYASDIFSFGVMAYNLVTGKMPFSAFSLDEVRRQQVSRSFEVAEPRKFNSDIAPKLNWIILRCLEKDCEKRFPSMAYLLQELGRI